MCTTNAKQKVLFITIDLQLLYSSFLERSCYCCIGAVVLHLMLHLNLGLTRWPCKQNPDFQQGLKHKLPHEIAWWQLFLLAKLLLVCASARSSPPRKTPPPASGRAKEGPSRVPRPNSRSGFRRFGLGVAADFLEDSESTFRRDLADFAPELLDLVQPRLNHKMFALIKCVCM